jgi:hypothetical protein
MSMMKVTAHQMTSLGMAEIIAFTHRGLTRRSLYFSLAVRGAVHAAGGRKRKLKAIIVPAAGIHLAPRIHSVFQVQPGLVAERPRRPRLSLPHISSSNRIKVQPQ